MTRDDFSGIVVGDTVAVRRGFRGSPTIHPVVKVTPKQIVLKSLGNGSDWRFWRENGYAVSDSGWERRRISLVTDSVRAEIQRLQALRKLTSTNWEGLSTDTLLAVVTLLAEPKP